MRRKSEDIERITKIAECQAFDLKTLLQNDKVHDLKWYFNDLGKNINSVSIETQNQINTMSRIMKIISAGIPDIDKTNEAMKLRIKRRRRGIKTQDQTVSSEQQSIDAEGNVIYGSRKTSKQNTSTQSKSGGQDENVEGESEVSPLENLLIYLEDNFNNMYKEGGKILDIKTISRSSILDILDTIPQSILVRFEALNAEKVSIPVQTDESYIADHSSSTTTQKAPLQRRMTIRPAGGSMLAKTLMKFLGNK